MHCMSSKHCGSRGLTERLSKAAFWYIIFAHGLEVGEGCLQLPGNLALGEGGEAHAIRAHGAKTPNLKFDNIHPRPSSSLLTAPADI